LAVELDELLAPDVSNKLRPRPGSEPHTGSSSSAMRAA